MLVGKVYRSAVALYCIHSLQSVSVLPHILAIQKMFVPRTRTVRIYALF